MNPDRRCGKCREMKSATAFSRSSNASAWCKECCRVNAAKWRATNPERAKEFDHGRQGRQQTPEGKEWMRAWRLLNKYGITVEQFDVMYEAQGGRCAICGGLPWAGKRLAIDHDHETGAVRGLLCQGCNGALGLMKDDPERLLGGAAYLLTARELVRDGMLSDG